MSRYLAATVSAVALFVSMQARAADTIADANLTCDPALIETMGLDCTSRHPTLDHPQMVAMADPKFVSITTLKPILQSPSQVIVIIGDSIMAGLGQFAPGIVNLAISGTTTDQILALEVPNIPHNAKEVFVEGGLNNFATRRNSQDQIVPDYRTILAQLPAGATVKLIGILPINEAVGHTTVAGPVTNAKIAAVDASLAKLCTGSCSVLTVPTVPLKPDGIHPNAAGNAVLRKAIVGH